VRKDSVVGHEICGEIAEVGKNVQGFSVGEHVSIANVIPCGHCPACLSGRENACMNRKAIGYEFNGGFEEYDQPVSGTEGNLPKKFELLNV